MPTTDNPPIEDVSLKWTAQQGQALIETVARAVREWTAFEGKLDSAIPGYVAGQSIKANKLKLWAFGKLALGIEYKELMRYSPRELYQLIETYEELNKRQARTLQTQRIFQPCVAEPIGAIAEEANEHTEGGTGANTRSDFIRPLLKNKGWSDRDWARESRVDHHTVRSYLHGQTNPYPSTRKKLADSLDIAVVELPK